MAEQDFTPALAAARHEQVAKAIPGDGDSALGIIQLYAIKSIMDRRVMSAAEAIQDPLAQRAVLITAYRGLGADLLAKFSVRDVVDIPSRKFAAAREFLESVALTTGTEIGARA